MRAGRCPPEPAIRGFLSLGLPPKAGTVGHMPISIAVAADHAGFQLKDLIAAHLNERGYEVLDLGTNSPDRVDYPDFGAALGRSVAAGDAHLGIGVCGSGIGIGMAANKVHGVRAAVVHDETSARLAREHNNANVLCMGERLIGEAVAIAAVDEWLDAEFQGGRHTGRVQKLDELI